MAVGIKEYTKLHGFLVLISEGATGVLVVSKDIKHI